MVSVSERWLRTARRAIGAVGLTILGVAFSTAAPAAVRTNCGVAGAKRIASDGRLVVIEASRQDPTVGMFTDLEACIGSQRPKQVDVLSAVDSSCHVREVRTAAQRYVGVDIRCTDPALEFVADNVYSFDVARDRVWRGSREAAMEDFHRSFVLAANGAIAYVWDTAQGTIVFGCDAHANCRADGDPSRKLDKARRAAAIDSLRVRGDTVSWRHESTRRSARLF
jgi:hypothetical protein